MLNKQCGRCMGTGFVSNPDTGTIGCSLCAGCHGSGQEPEVKVHILSAEVTLHNKPRYIAWPTDFVAARRLGHVEVVRADGSVERHNSYSLVWGFYVMTGRTHSPKRFIAYRVIEQE